MDKRSQKQKKKKKGKMPWIIAVCFIFIFVLGFGIVYYYLNKFQYKNIEKEKLSISDVNEVNDKINNEQKEHKVKNILLLGVDNQEKASDSILVLSLDDTTKQLKLSSLMRDTYINFGTGKVTKLNYAYHYGGAELSIKTINEKFKLDISEYVLVDFNGLTKIIDRVGGIEVNVKPEEVNLLNSYAKNIAKIDKVEYTPIKKSGDQLLNGQQATAYCRIRYVGNQDYERTERQRRVLQKIFDKLKDMPITNYTKIINDISPYVETSLSTIDMVNYGSKIASYGKNGIKETRCPYDGLRSDSIISGTYYMQWNEDENVKKLHEFIYFN